MNRNCRRFALGFLLSSMILILLPALAPAAFFQVVIGFVSASCCQPPPGTVAIDSCRKL